MTTVGPGSSSSEAQQSLDAATAAERRVVEAIGYGRAGPFLILWGIVWLIAFTAAYLRPSQTGWICLVADAVGILGTVGLGFHLHKRTASSRRSLADRARPWLTVAAFFAYAALWPLLLRSGHPHALSIYAGAMTGFAYVLVGLWLGRLMTWLGLAVTALFLVGLAADVSWFALYAAVAGGGGLMVAGWLFLRQDPT